MEARERSYCMRKPEYLEKTHVVCPVTASQCTATTSNQCIELTTGFKYPVFGDEYLHVDVPQTTVDSAEVICQECNDKFMIRQFGEQQSLSQQKFLMLNNIGIKQCSRECLIRTKCKAVAYNLGDLTCYLGEDDGKITASLYPEDLASTRPTLLQFENQLLKSCLGHSCHESSVCVELSNGTSACVSFLLTNTTNSGSTGTTQDPVVCGNLPDISGTDSPTSTERSAGTVITYHCNAGLVAKGNANTTCQADGQWSALSLICKNCDTTYFVFNEKLNFCYRIEDSTRNTYTGAILQCMNMGGKLAKVDSAEKIKAILVNLTAQSYVDGTDIAEDGTWVHSDGTAVNMELFKTGHPKLGNTNCLSVRADTGKTLDIDCTLNKYSICEQV